jgi:hypothetical protein
MFKQLDRLFAIRRVLERNALKIHERYLPNGRLDVTPAELNLGP